MPALKEVLQRFQKFLKDFPVFSSFPFSLLLIGLEELIEIGISCPCKYELNIFLTASIFIGPPLFAFALMFMVLRPFTLECYLCSANVQQKPTDAGGNGQQKPNNVNGDGNDQQKPTNVNGDGNDQQKPTNVNGDRNDQQKPTNVNEGENDNFWKALGHCLIPPIMLIIYMFLDGDYVACGLTKWEGNYEFDEVLKRSWCKPIEQANAGNQSDLRLEYQGYISISKTLGYAVLGVFGVFIIIFTGIYDCFKSGKCDCFKNEKSVCCKGTHGQESTQREGSVLLTLTPPEGTIE